MWLLDKMLRRIVREGSLEIISASGRHYIYGTPQPNQSPLIVRFTDRAAPTIVALNPRLGAAETFMDGRLVIENGDILALMVIIRGNKPWEKGKSGIDSSLLQRVTQGAATRLDRLNWERRSRRNVAHHYDLDERLYALFLDEDRQYSCGYFVDPDRTLEQAQADKKAHIAAKLALEPGQRVLDIGCGWGGMALYLNRVADVDVLGITLSEEQLKVARRRAEEAGVADRVRFELIDYRAVTGRFDRIVSVGMFEHVGPPFYRTFFDKCRSLLADDGVMLLHTIGRADGPAPTDRWLARYIFPGGYVPALSQIAPAIEEARLWITDIEVLRLHYAQTLVHWYCRFEAARAEIVALYDERFFRMWQFYLAGAIVAFRYDAHLNFQLQITRRRDALPLVRDYIARNEADLRADR